MSDIPRGKCNTGPRNTDGTWVGGVARGPYKEFPFPIGAQFGELTIVEWRNRRGSKGTSWQPWCKCSCGWEGFVQRENIKAGRSTRCNACAKRAAGRMLKHYYGYADIVPDDQHRERLLNRISACIQRCHNPKDRQYVNYGGRGIFVFEQWRIDRRSFLSYLITLPFWDVPYFELDREDNDRGYEPGNLRFVPAGVNAKNKSTVRALRIEIERLHAENADLRHRLSRAEESLHNLDRLRSCDCP